MNAASEAPLTPFDPGNKRRQQAAKWMLAIRANPALHEDDAFRRWLALDPANVRAFSDAGMAWDIAAELAEPVALPAPRARFWMRRAVTSFASAAVALVLTGAWVDQVRPDLRLHLTADYVAAPGAARTIDLPDGTQAVLDGGSALDFTQDGDARRVTVLAGAAYFDVKKDGRSFTVSLGDTSVRALGTRFDVRDCGGCALVTLEEGRVEVTSDAAAPLELSPGQQLRVAASPTLREIDPSEALSWRQGRYTFQDASLREISGVLERHGAGAIIFGDDKLADRVISGSINLSDPEQELRALSRALGFRIIPLPGANLLI